MRDINQHEKKDTVQPHPLRKQADDRHLQLLSDTPQHVRRREHARQKDGDKAQHVHRVKQHGPPLAAREENPAAFMDDMARGRDHKRGRWKGGDPTEAHVVRKQADGYGVMHKPRGGHARSRRVQRDADGVVDVKRDDCEEARVGHGRVAVKGVGADRRVEEQDVDVERGLEKLEEEVERAAVPVEAVAVRELSVAAEGGPYDMLVQQLARQQRDQRAGYHGDVWDCGVAVVYRHDGHYAVTLALTRRDEPGDSQLRLQDIQYGCCGAAPCIER